MKQAEITLKNEFGLHMRPAQGLMKLALQQPGDVFVEKDGIRANAKSIVELIGLAAAAGDSIVLICDGDGEDQSLKEIAEFLENLPELYEEDRVG